MSQWYPAQFTIDGITYACAEQWMMASKARLFGDEVTLKKILAAKDPKEMKSLGRQVRNFNADVWNQEACSLVIAGNVAKFSQNPELESFLLNTGNMILVEASPYDKIWGIGMSKDDPDVRNPHCWKGTNWLGFCLMAARDCIRR